MSANKNNDNESPENTIINMLAYLCIAKESEASLVRKVDILDRFDLSDAAIARICDSLVQSVRNARQVLKRQKRGKSGK